MGTSGLLEPMSACRLGGSPIPLLRVVFKSHRRMTHDKASLSLRSIDKMKEQALNMAYCWSCHLGFPHALMLAFVRLQSLESPGSCRPNASYVIALKEAGPDRR